MGVDQHIVYKVVEGHIDQRGGSQNRTGQRDADKAYIAVDGKQTIGKMFFFGNPEEVWKQEAAEEKDPIGKQDEEQAVQKLPGRNLGLAAQCRIDQVRRIAKMGNQPGNLPGGIIGHQFPAVQDGSCQDQHKYDQHLLKYGLDIHRVVLPACGYSENSV